MTKRLLILFFLITTFAAGFGQITDIRKSKPTYVQFDDRSAESESLSFSKIEVIDLRFDTTKFGYLPGQIYCQKLETKEPFSQHLNTQLNERYKKSLPVNSTKTLVIVIKRYWVSFTDPTNTTTNISESDVIGLSANTVIETFVKSGEQYTPVVRIDSIFRKKGKRSWFYVYPFDYAIARANSYLIPNTRKSMSPEMFSDYYYKRFSAPKMTADEKEKGIYLTFKDFLNNNVTQQDFNVKFGKLTDELFIKRGEQESVLENFWGFCDGEKEYIKIGFSLFPMIRSGNTYEFMGAKHITIESSGGYTNSQTFGRSTVPTYHTRSSLFLRPMQLDMETGVPY